MTTRLILWLGLGAAGVALLFGASAPPVTVPTPIVGLALLLGSLCLAVAVIGAGWDIVRVINARVGSPTTSQTDIPSPVPAPTNPDSQEVGRGQLEQWSAARDSLIREASGIEAAVRALVLAPNDDGIRKDLVAARTWREAKNWISSVDEFEDHWHVGPRPILGNGVLSRWLGGMQFVPAIPVPKPLWRQNLVRDITYRLARLRSLDTPPQL